MELLSLIGGTWEYMLFSEGLRLLAIRVEKVTRRKWRIGCVYNDLFVRTYTVVQPPFTLAYAEYFLNKCGNVPGNWTTDCQQVC